MSNERGKDKEKSTIVTTMTMTTMMMMTKEKLYEVSFLTFEIIESNSHTHPALKRLKGLKASESIGDRVHTRISLGTFFDKCIKAFSIALRQKS